LYDVRWKYIALLIVCRELDDSSSVMPPANYTAIAIISTDPADLEEVIRTQMDRTKLSQARLMYAIAERGWHGGGLTQVWISSGDAEFSLTFDEFKAAFGDLIDQI
jgi:hypothetical protein